MAIRELDPDALNALDEEHLNRIFDVRPEIGTRLGLRERDDALPDGGPDGRAALHTALTNWVQARAEVELTDVDAYQKESFALDQSVLEDSLTFFKHCDTHLAFHEKDPDALTDLSELFFTQLRADDQAPEERYQHLAARLKAVPTYLEQFRTGITTPDAMFRDIAVALVPGTGQLFTAIGEAARQTEGVDESLATDVASAVNDCMAALEEHKEWLEGLDVQAQTWVQGPDQLDALLNARKMQLSHTELWDLGRARTEELRLEERRICRMCFGGASPQEAIAQARQQAPYHFGEAVAWIQELIAQARQVLTDSGVFPLPETDGIVVEATPPAFRPLVSKAAFFAAPKFAPNQQGIYVITDAGDPALLSELSVGDLENMVAHEIFPGRHLHAVWSNLATSVARSGVPTGMAEGPSEVWGLETKAGWGHLAEEWARELGFRESPAGRLIMTRHALLRAIRVVVDVGLASGKLTLDEAALLMVEKAALPEAAARAELRRMIRRPTQALSYLAGKTALSDLRRKAKVDWRHSYTDRAFTEFVLYTGSVPASYLHAQLGDGPLVFGADDSEVTAG